MKPPHLCHVFPAFATGGPEVRTCLLINALDGEFRHTIISLSGDLSGQTRLHHPQTVRLVPAPRPPTRFQKPFALARLIREQAPDLVLTYGWGGTDAVVSARLSGIRRVIHGEDGFLPDEAGQQKWTRLMARRFVLRMPAVVVCPSRTLVDIATRLWRLPRQRIRYLPNGVDLGRFAPPSPAAAAEARKRFGLAPADVVIGNVGHLRAEKNQERLLRAFAPLAARRAVKLLLVGDGPLRENLQHQARTLHMADRVIFAGLVDDPLAAYHAMDIFALSSDTEQMPLALLEAMAVGLPVVCTDVGDIRSMVSAESRRQVVPASDKAAYAQALAQLVENAEARARLGQGGLWKCRQEFDVTKMIETYRALFWQTLG